MCCEFPGFSFCFPWLRSGVEEPGNLEVQVRTRDGAAYQDRKLLDNDYSLLSKCHREITAQPRSWGGSLDIHPCQAAGALQTESIPQRDICVTAIRASGQENEGRTEGESKNGENTICSPSLTEFSKLYLTVEAKNIKLPNMSLMWEEGIFKTTMFLEKKE